jgi:hypothetical protein
MNNKVYVVKRLYMQGDTVTTHPDLEQASIEAFEGIVYNSFGSLNKHERVIFKYFDRSTQIKTHLDYEHHMQELLE